MAYKVIIVKLEICLLRCEILFKTDLICTQQKIIKIIIAIHYCL
jgi:hypothetical protein